MAKPRLWRVAAEEFRRGNTKHFGRRAAGFIMIPALHDCGY